MGIFHNIILYFFLSSSIFWICRVMTFEAMTFFWETQYNSLTTISCNIHSNQSSISTSRNSSFPPACCFILSNVVVYDKRIRTGYVQPELVRSTGFSFETPLKKGGGWADERTCSLFQRSLSAALVRSKRSSYRDCLFPITSCFMMFEECVI